ncbi:MAG: hypothetical protein BMS9Abin30_0318 [Gammaproteobacteria bacterium]|nr:MAG: hypothetical protein BMS9Abin30_0318 [Gammaproteobacteria bacterium]
MTKAVVIKAGKIRGFTLIELMISIAIGAFLLLGMVELFAGMKSSYRFQEGMARVQENGRIAINLMAHELRLAGHTRPVWDDPQSGFYPITGGALDGGGAANDTLQLMYQDDLDCFGVSNGAANHPETNLPVTWYKRVTFSVNGNDQLTWNCEYGASTGALAVQINAETIIEGVDSFQLLYGVDTDLPSDFALNSWALASAINPKTTICLQSRFLCETEAGLMAAMSNGVPVSVQIGLLLRSPDSAGGRDGVAFTVLDQAVAAANDNLYRQLFTTTVNLRNLTL